MIIESGGVGEMGGGVQIYFKKFLKNPTVLQVYDTISLKGRGKIGPCTLDDE